MACTQHNNIEKTGSNVENMEQLEPSYITGGSINWYDHFGKVLAVSTKAEYKPPHNPITPFLSTYCTEINEYVHWKAHTRVFTAVLMIMAQNWK